MHMEYQVNLLIELLAVALSLAGSLFMLSLFFGPGLSLGGWSWSEALVVQGFYTVFDGMASTWLRPNLGSIVTHVREGTLDFVLLNPIDSQFWLSLRLFSPMGLPEIALGLLLVGWGGVLSGVSISVQTLVLLALVLAIGVVILYWLWISIAATRIDSISDAAVMPL